MKNEKLLYWHVQFIRELNKRELAIYLSTRYATFTKNSPIYLPELQSCCFNNEYDLLLTCLHELTCIQIYSDNLIRLHLNHNSYIVEPKSIILDNCLSYGLAQDLIAFSEN